MMRKHDPQVQEDGFALVKAVALEHVTDLVSAYSLDEDDHGLRCWLLELIGEAAADGESAIRPMGGALTDSD